jgi:hypothetical protein
MLAASGCAYSINGTSYQPASGDPFGPALGWTTSGNTPTVITGGFDNEDAALVGTITLAGTSTTAIVVAFEGSVPITPVTLDSALTWLQNFLASPEYVSNLHGSVHGGIYAAVNNIFSQLLDAIANLQNSYPDAPLYITGHSKGGGMASLFAAMVYWTASDTLQPAAVYTFASPMIGLPDFVSSFPSGIPVYRYENTLDQVPFLAPSDDYIATLKSNEHIIPHLTLVLDGIVLLLEQFAGYGYVPLGKLYYIDGTTVSNPASNPCANLIGQTLAEGTSGLDTVMNAHSHLCSYGYMTGTCNDMGVCPITV